MKTVFPNKRLKKARVMNNLILYIILFSGFLFDQFSAVSAFKYIKGVKRTALRKNVLRSTCPICFDQDMLSTISENCQDLSSVVDINDLPEEDYMCLCNASKINSDISKCQLCAGIDIEEFQNKCQELENFVNDVNKNVTSVYITETLNNKIDDDILVNDNKNTNNKSYIHYSLIGGGVIFVATTGLFAIKKMINTNRSNEENENEEIQMDPVSDFHNLNNINVDNYYNKKSPLMQPELSMSGNQISNVHFNNRDEMYLSYPSTSASEPALNRNYEPHFNKLDNSNGKIISAPNIPKTRGILVNKEKNNIKESRISSIDANSADNMHDYSPVVENKSPKATKPRVTFSKGLTTMHEFMSKEWNKAVECEGLKKESLISLGWHHGVVVHNFNPTKEDEIRLRIGDCVIIRLAFDDGWAYAFNRNTGVVGMIPVICVKPVRDVQK